MMGAMLVDDRVIKPSRWRKQHGRVEAVSDQMQDSDGNIGAPYRGLTLLDHWERTGRISKEMKAAGDHFAELFHIAALSPIAAADMSRAGGCPAPAKHRGSPRAQDQVHDAIAALGGSGSPAGCCVWLVLGCELSLREFATRGGWRGWAIDQKVAAGILIGSLGTLAKHFGY